MAEKGRLDSHGDLSALSKNILRDIRADFVAKGLSASKLSEEYDGVSIESLEQKYCQDGEATKVDFDLALKGLEESKFVATGPMAPFDNDPDSSVIVLMMFSKREFAYLTEAGYRAAAQIDREKPSSNRTNVHISGGNFHQSQIGIGEQVTQAQRVDIENDAQAIESLSRLLSQTGAVADEKSRGEIARLVDVAKHGNGGEAKPIFQRLFGLASEGVKQAAWGVVTALITKALGM